MSASCPYCPPEPGYEGWGGSDEFWAEAKRTHEQDHAHPMLGELNMQLIETNTALMAAEAQAQKAYEAGESNMQADWEIALDDILPDGVECCPSQVGAYILGLQDHPDNGANGKRECCDGADGTTSRGLSE